MDKHACKLCLRRFSNGRALGGHMRSHVAPNHQPQASACLVQQPSSSVSLPTSLSSSSGPEEDDGVTEKAMEASNGCGGDAGVGGFYALRENPRKSFKFVDPEFSAVDYSCFIFSTTGNNNNSASVVVQDRESETESSVPPSLSSSFRRRSRRRRRHSPPAPPPALEVEPVSSVSDTTPDEDVARCLIMLSRDVWSKTIDRPKPPEEQAEEDEEGEEEQLVVSEAEKEEKVRKRSKKIDCSSGSGRIRFQCGTCKKVFRSYQALGGHRASHKKIKTCVAPAKTDKDDDDGEYDNERNENRRRQIRRDEAETNADGNGDTVGPRIHGCPFCFRVFSSGQALGGHKRSHFTSGSYPSPPPPPISPAGKVTSVNAPKVGESLIDLNLPAPMDDEEAEVDFSAVSAAS